METPRQQLGSKTLSFLIGDQTLVEATRQLGLELSVNRWRAPSKMLYSVTLTCKGMGVDYSATTYTRDLDIINFSKAVEVENHIHEKLVDALLKMPHKDRVRLYEGDPRIGFPAEFRLPESPLFDRPDNSASRVQEMILSRGPAICPFCDEYLTTNSSAWAGGLVGWAHRHCYPRIQDMRSMYEEVCLDLP